MARYLSVTMVERARERREHRAHVALGLAAVAVTPLLLFAALWACLLLMLGGMWALNALGLV